MNRDKVESLKRQFGGNPPDWEKIREELAAETFSEIDLAELANDVTEGSSGEYTYTALEILLENGLNPNACIDEENAMWNTQWIEEPNVGACSLRLLLEHGGDPNLCPPGEVETLFEFIQAKVSEDVDENDYLRTVQCWWVLLAYGGCRRDGTVPIVMLDGREVGIFRDFERFYFTIERTDPKNTHAWRMHIFNRETGEEVARY